MKAGDIVFVRGNSPISHAIRIFDKGDFSHVAIAVSDTHVLEAQWFTRSRITPFYYKDYDIVELNLSDWEQIDAIKLGIQLVGKWYDYSQIIGYVLNNGKNNPNNLICSEIIAIILTDLGIIENYLEVADITPNELYTLLKGRGY